MVRSELCEVLEVPYGSLPRFLQSFEKCFKALSQSSQYQNNDKFVLVGVEYAMVCNNGQRVFEFMQKKSIGLNSAKFWMEYAKLLEKIGQFSKAKAIYEEGMSQNCGKNNELSNGYKSFLTRCPPEGM